MNKNYIQVSLIDTTINKNSALENILNAINTYLIRNRGAISDFDLMKDIVERNTESLNEEIDSQVPIPLYLGLMGTMLGIIIGLFFIPSIDNMTDSSFKFGDKVTYTATDEKGKITKVNPDNTYTITFNSGAKDAFSKNIKESEIKKPIGVDILLGGVKIAMISSFIGLLLTVILSGWLYKRAKTISETNKNLFYTFIQTELLPVMANDSASVMRSLEKTLLKFNQDFGVNSATFNSNFHTLNAVIYEIKGVADSFTGLMQQIRQLNLLKITKVNAELLGKIHLTTKEFDHFNEYLAQMNNFIDNTLKLNTTISKQLNRTESVELIAENIKENLIQNEKIITYLDAGLMEIDNRKQIMSNAVIDVDAALQKSIEGLHKHTEESILAIKEFQIKQENAFENLLVQDKGNLDKLKNLDAVKSNLDKLITNSTEQNTQLKNLNKILGDFLEKNTKNDTKPVFNFPKPLVISSYVFLATGSVIGVWFVGQQIFKWIFG